MERGDPALTTKPRVQPLKTCIHIQFGILLRFNDFHLQTTKVTSATCVLSSFFVVNLNHRKKKIHKVCVRIFLITLERI